MTRKFSYGLLLTAALLLSVVSCTENYRMGYEEDVPLTFDPALNELCRAAQPSGEYPDGQDFGVSVWDYNAGSAQSQWMAFLPDAKVSLNDGKWTPEGDLLWPSKSRLIAVLAHSPYGKASSISIANGIEFKGVDVSTDQTDLLYTELVRDQAKTSGAVCLPFRHALCYLDFAMRTNLSQSKSVEVRRLALKTIYTAGDFRSLPEPEWTAKGSAHEVEYFRGSAFLGLSNKTLEPGLWTIPQNLQSVVCVDLAYTDSNGILQYLSLESEPLTKMLEPGRHYTVSLSFNTEDLTLILNESFNQQQ